jgi:hypothetical protein
MKKSPSTSLFHNSLFSRKFLPDRRQQLLDVIFVFALPPDQEQAIFFAERTTACIVEIGRESSRRIKLINGSKI